MLSPRTFRLEIGVNLSASNLDHSPPNENLFPLQNALVDITQDEQPRPAWYSIFRPQDELVFRLVDITRLLEPPAPPMATVALHVDIAPLGQQQGPFTEMPASWSVESMMMRRKSPPFNPEPIDLPTWEIQPLDENGQPISLIFALVKGLTRFELSVALDVDLGSGDIRKYVFDPELVVSETGGGMGLGSTVPGH